MLMFRFFNPIKDINDILLSQFIQNFCSLSKHLSAFYANNTLSFVKTMKY